MAILFHSFIGPPKHTFTTQLIRIFHLSQSISAPIKMEMTEQWPAALHWTGRDWTGLAGSLYHLMESFYRNVIIPHLIRVEFK